MAKKKKIKSYKDLTLREWFCSVCRVALNADNIVDPSLIRDDVTIEEWYNKYKDKKVLLVSNNNSRTYDA